MDGFHGSAVPDGEVRAEFIPGGSLTNKFSHSPEAEVRPMVQYNVLPWYMSCGRFRVRVVVTNCVDTWATWLEVSTQPLYAIPLPWCGYKFRWDRWLQVS